MGVDYIPERDHRAGSWMKNFARALVERPEQYRTTPESAAEIAALVHAYRVAFRATWTPGVISSPVIRRKNDTRRAAERRVRAEAQRIRTDPLIDRSLKAAIGLNPGTKRRRRVLPPESAPFLIINAELTGVVRIRVRDSRTDRSARPKEAIGLELYERVTPRDVVDAPGTQPAIEPEPGVADVPAGERPPGWRFVGMYTTPRFGIHPSTENPGDEVSLLARWITRRGETGPFGQVASVRVPFGIPMRLSALHHRGDRRTLAA